MKTHDTSPEDEMVFSTIGSSIDEAYAGVEFDMEQDVDDTEEDDYSENDYE